MQVQSSDPSVPSHFVKQQKVEKTFEEIFQGFQQTPEFKCALTNIESKVKTYSSDIYKTIKLDLIEDKAKGITQFQVEFFELLMKIASFIVYALESSPVDRSLFNVELPLLQTLLQISNDVSVDSLSDFSKGLSKKEQILNFESFEYEQGQKYDPSERIIPEFLTLLHHVIMGITCQNTDSRTAIYVNGQVKRLTSMSPDNEDSSQDAKADKEIVDLAKKIFEDVKLSRKNKSISFEAEKQAVLVFSDCVIRLIAIAGKNKTKESLVQVKELKRLMISQQFRDFQQDCQNQSFIKFLQFIKARLESRLKKLTQTAQQFERRSQAE